MLTGRPLRSPTIILIKAIIMSKIVEQREEKTILKEILKLMEVTQIAKEEFNMQEDIIDYDQVNKLIIINSHLNLIN